MGATLISKINSKIVRFILPRTIILECKVLDKIVIVFKWMPIHKNQTYCIDAHLINQGLLKCFSCSWINALFLDTKHMGSGYIGITTITYNSLRTYRKVASSRQVYYSILDSYGQRSQYISINFPLHKQSENPWVCY